MLVANGLRTRFPGLGKPMDDAEHDVLAYRRFPAEHRRQIHLTNPLERLNGEVKKRTRVVGIFPNDDAITRLVGAILLERNDEWAVSRRDMTLETMTAISDDAQAGRDTQPALTGNTKPELSDASADKPLSGT